MTRREWMQMAGCGFGSTAMAATAATAGESGPLAVKAPHFAPKAKHVIFLFLNGGLSQVDTFDPKPELTRNDGKPLPGPKVKTDSATGNLMASPFQFRKYGQSGIEVSEIFPKVGERIDDFCVIRSCFADNGNHGPSLMLMNTGHQLAGRPSMGSWITYGLGTENQNLPGFVALCPGYPVMGPRLWSSGFLPNIYQGTYVPNNERTVDKLLLNIRNQSLTIDEQQRQLSLMDRLNQLYLARSPGQPKLAAGVEAMEVAFRMQMQAPEAFDIDKEKEATRSRYGDSEFGRGCLLARRLVERGVRMVQVYFGNSQPWDSHEDIRSHKGLARQADPAIASLVDDLKERGLFKETLIVVGSEFGRTPMIQSAGQLKVNQGRDHNVHGFTTLLAGGGIKGGMTYGATEDFGLRAVEKKVHPHDLQATTLHLLGLDHTRLTYRYSGRDFRLTDVGGKVIDEILA
ncbi:MAG: DUF1501 domain-containing protein [Bryobacterales bacterium]|nr:DUF1501 domain-containing protein [Bryobacterales bacterium]